MANNLTPANATNYGTLIAGIWLIVAPFILGYVDSAAITNDVIVGILLGGLSLVRLFSNFRPSWLSWANIVLGFWLIIAPFVLGYTLAASQWNDIIVGIVVVALGAWNEIFRAKV
jgi:hypothetical protein